MMQNMTLTTPLEKIRIHRGWWTSSSLTLLKDWKESMICFSLFSFLDRNNNAVGPPPLADLVLPLNKLRSRSQDVVDGHAPCKLSSAASASAAAALASEEPSQQHKHEAATNLIGTILFIKCGLQTHLHLNQSCVGSWNVDSGIVCTHANGNETIIGRCQIADVQRCFGSLQVRGESKTEEAE
jgi:hypothetical protein